VSSWALDGVAPGIHPDAWVHPEASRRGLTRVG
jgi:hypothetical protein